MEAPRAKTCLTLLATLFVAVACGDSPTGVGDLPADIQPMLNVADGAELCGTQYPNASTWYVKSGALAAVATGDKGQPFASLADAEAASGPGDAIVVLHVPAERAALDGGITLKDCQKLLGTFPSTTIASPEATRSKITNGAGDAVVLADYNEVAGLHIESPGRHAIVATNATGADIHDNLITGWNQLELDDVPFFGFPFSRAGVMLDTDAGVNEIYISDNVMRDASSTAIAVRASGGGSEALAEVHGNVIDNIDGSGVFFGGRTPAILGTSWDGATVNLTVANTTVDNIANRSDGIAALACRGSTSTGCSGAGSGGEMNLVVRHYSYRDTDGVSTNNSNGLETVTIPGARTTLLMEYSDIIGAFGFGLDPFNFLGKPTADIIDLGGGALGSVGQNRIFGNGVGGTRANLFLFNADVVAENNWWGTPDGLQLDCPFPIAPDGSSCAFIDIAGINTLDFEPFLTEDPRP